MELEAQKLSATSAGSSSDSLTASHGPMVLMPKGPARGLQNPTEALRPAFDFPANSSSIKSESVTSEPVTTSTLASPMTFSLTASGLPGGTKLNSRIRATLDSLVDVRNTVHGGVKSETLGDERPGSLEGVTSDTLVGSIFESLPDVTSEALDIVAPDLCGGMTATSLSNVKSKFHSEAAPTLSADPFLSVTQAALALATAVRNAGSSFPNETLGLHITAALLAPGSTGHSINTQLSTSAGTMTYAIGIDTWLNRLETEIDLSITDLEEANTRLHREQTRLAERMTDTKRRIKRSLAAIGNFRAE